MKRKLFLAALAVAFHAGAVEIIAHRGASHDAPENTLASFRLGYEQKADGDELDIHLTKDGRTIVCHDYDTGRTGGITNRIASHTLDELQKLDAGNWGQWKDKGFKEKFPTLEEVLELIPTGKKLFIEIKCGPEILPELKRVLAAAKQKPDQLPLIGFDYETMTAAKAQLPQFKALWLVSSDKKTKEYPPVGDLIEKAKAGKLDGLDLHSGFPIDKEFVAKVHAAGLQLCTWTVDDPEVARKEAEAGVDGITTNRPGWLREQLKR